MDSPVPGMLERARDELSALAVCLYEKFARQCGVGEFHLFESGLPFRGELGALRRRWSG